MELLKGVIGFIVDTKIPWTAQLPVYNYPQKTSDHRIRALHLKQHRLNKFEAVCVLESGQEVRAPKVKQIKTQVTKFGHCSLIAWDLVEIKLEQLIVIKGVKLIDDLGYLLVDCLLKEPLRGKKGDTIQLKAITISNIMD